MLEIFTLCSAFPPLRKPWACTRGQEVALWGRCLSREGRWAHVIRTAASVVLFPGRGPKSSPCQRSRRVTRVAWSQGAHSLKQCFAKNGGQHNLGVYRKLFKSLLCIKLIYSTKNITSTLNSWFYWYRFSCLNNILHVIWFTGKCK